MKSFLFNASLTVSWLLLFQYCQRNSFQDPSSVFYDPSRAYTRNYSATRESEADRFLERAASTPATAEKPWIYQGRNMDMENAKKLGGRRICIGIPSVRRQREQFTERTIASLVDTLSPEERKLINLKVLLADDTPQNHPAWQQPWLHNVADEVLVYGEEGDESQTDERQRITTISRQLFPGDGRNKRVQLDYANVIRACRATEADYFVLIEDDVIASRDWFQRLHRSLGETETQNTGADWLYLRLFYSETYMGWNSEEWPVYLRNSLLIYTAIILTVLLVRCRSAAVKPMKLSDVIKFNKCAIVQVTFWVAAYVALYFMAGRLLVNPYRMGVHEMPRYGCCAQGLAMPHRHLEKLEQRLREPPHELPGDSFVDMVADQEGLKKWAMVPSVLQHVGVRGSSEQGGYYKTTWNFGFEKGLLE
ncbi:Alpha-13-mannosyl-glyco 4-beta-N-acetylglucosaminyltransferase C [Fusarium albosuccineum]|uniref:Alpha-13-mannosyl-glyco 4-beta-N-acetylglucosaminyltransferase C n=1 Tax=Fusarium albosuccineum TaxID=1237068 RepID=A0A8H4PA48_9HYPO|nr:Alpha-13-mannosyl-glyco 4-beta-N-acetylglucosaminyltransferase C [Fusarium albosuccineum]